MKKSKQQFWLKWLTVIILILGFSLTRAYIILDPAYNETKNIFGHQGGFSDAKHYHERYANMWQYGIEPYFQHYYEYPPASIPLLYFPLWLDLHGIGHYYQNYRLQGFVMDAILFTTFLILFIRSKKYLLTKTLSIIFYIIAGLTAKEYWYEGIDLIFFGTYCLGVLIWLNPSKFLITKKTIAWILLWLSTAIKLMTAPLLVILALIDIKLFGLKKALIWGMVSFFIVWGVPGLYYRTALSSFITFNANRPMKYGAFGSWWVELINDFTRTEHRVDKEPDYQMEGPISQKIYPIFLGIYALAMLFVVGLGIYTFVIKSKKTDQNGIILLSLLYIWLIILTAKTVSSPFHIWYVPVLTLLIFKKPKTALIWLTLAWCAVMMDTTELIVAPEGFLGVVPFKRIRDFFRFIPTMALVALTLNQFIRHYLPHKSPK